MLETSVGSLHVLFVRFIRHFCQYYLSLNEKSHEFELNKTFLKNFFESRCDETVDFDSKVTELFKLYEQHNKAFTMLNLTKKSERARSTLDSTNSACHDEMITSSDSKYLQRDARFRYQIWSNEMIPTFLAYLKENVFTDTAKSTFKLNLNENVGKYLVHLIVVFNSCSSYCQCLTFENNSSKSDLIRTKEMSADILASIFRELNSFKQ